MKPEYNSESIMHNTIIPKDETSSFMSKVYLYMTANLLLTFAIAWWAGTAGYSMTDFGIIGLIAYIAIMWILIVIIDSVNMMLKHPSLVIGSVFLFGAILGLMMSYITLFTTRILGEAFISTTVIFIVMSMIGLTTKANLTKLGTILTGLLITLIIISLVEVFFFHSSLLAIIISFGGAIIFTIMIMVDNQRIGHMYSKYSHQIPLQTLAASSSITLFLDFINLFTYILRILAILNGNRN